MHTLRNAHLLARLVLVWFALFIGAAVLSPVFQPASDGVWVCAAGGTKLVVPGKGDSAPKASAGMDCPLCAPVAAAPAAHGLTFEPPSRLSHALRPTVAAYLAWVSGSPLPPRGPPSFA